jgi:hypothetical protein
MVHIKDEGSHFDAPLETVWGFLQAPDDHRASHSTTTRNHQMKPITETSFHLTQERNVNGQWVKEVDRITVHPPLAVVIEVLEGPMAGSTMVNIYSAKGNKTGIDVYGEFNSKMIPAAQLEAAVRGNLESVFNEDQAAIKAFASKK